MKSVQYSNVTQESSNHTPFFQKKNSNSFFVRSDKSFFSPSPIQKKIKINQSNDPFGKEADTMADKIVLRSTAKENPTNNKNIFQAKPILSFITPVLQKKCLASKEYDEKKVQPKSETSSMQLASPFVESNLISSKGSGNSLPVTTRERMENSFGADFSNVRLHTSSSAVQMNGNLHAQAFTHGNDIYFSSGKYDTMSTGGKHLLAHELTHVLQQNPSKTIQKQSESTTPTTETPTGTPIEATPQHPECYGRTLLRAEIEERLTIYQDMVRGITGEISQKDSVLRAMCSFSLHQLGQMRDAGVRFWPPGSLPPLPDDIRVEVPERGLSAYIAELRVIRLSTSSVSALRHELAHGWDHVRIMRRRFRLDDLSGSRVERIITTDQQLGSDMSTRHRIRVGGRGIRMSIEQIFQAYRERMRGRPREQAFGTPAAREGYSLSNVRDFYAEGYAVFNSGLDDQQLRMRSLAPELYAYFQQEAERENLPVPVLEATEP